MRSGYAYLIAAVAADSGLLFGFATAVINGALLFLREELGLSTRGTEVATSSLLVGCAIGAAFAGWLTDRLGRKRILIVSALLFAVSAVGAAVPRHLGIDARTAIQGFVQTRQDHDCRSFGGDAYS